VAAGVVVVVVIVVLHDLVGLVVSVDPAELGVPLWGGVGGHHDGTDLVGHAHAVLELGRLLAGGSRPEPRFGPDRSSWSTTGLRTAAGSAPVLVAASKMVTAAPTPMTRDADITPAEVRFIGRCCVRTLQGRLSVASSRRQLLLVLELTGG
jgi:hypothetical protein